MIKTIHDKMSNPQNVRLPHELLHGLDASSKQSRIPVPQGLHGRALEDHMTFIPQGIVITLLAVPSGPRIPA